MASSISISPWSFEGLYLTGRLGLPEIIELTAELGADSIDINELYFGLSPNPDVPRLREIRRLCDSAGLGISSCWCWADLLGGAVMSSPDTTLRHVERYFAVCELLGARFLTLQNGNLPPGMGEAEGRALILEMYPRLDSLAQEYGVVVGFEAARAGSAFNSPQGALALAREFGSPRLTVTPDFESWRRPTERMPMRYAEDPDSVVAEPLPLRVLEECIPYSPFVHAKILEIDDSGTDPNFPLAEMFAAFKAGGHDHVYCIEYEGWIPDIHPDRDPVAENRRSVELIRGGLF